MPNANRLPTIAANYGRPCPVCSMPAGRTRVISGKLAISGAPLEIVTCSRCGVTFQPDRPDPATMARWYDYMGRVAMVASEPTMLLGRRLSRLLDVAEPYRTSNRLLDVGCGRGTLVLAARERGWETYATEISATCVADLRPLLGERLHHGDLLDLPFAAGSFDAIFFVEVLEHLSEPEIYLRAAFDLLRPGGALVVTTPNYRGLSGRFRGTAWRVVADEHLTYYGPGTLARTLSHVGFTNIRLATTGLDIGPLVSGFRAIGTPQAAATGGSRASASMASRAAVPAADQVIEIANSVLRATRLGDSLRAVAERPQVRD